MAAAFLWFSTHTHSRTVPRVVVQASYSEVRAGLAALSDNAKWDAMQHDGLVVGRSIEVQARDWDRQRGPGSPWAAWCGLDSVAALAPAPSWHVGVDMEDVARRSALPRAAFRV